MINIFIKNVKRNDIINDSKNEKFKVPIFLFIKLVNSIRSIIFLKV